MPATTQRQSQRQRPTQREWVYRFADQMVEASDYEMGLAEAARLGFAEYARWAAVEPETTVKRLIAVCQRDLAAAGRRPSA